MLKLLQEKPNLSLFILSTALIFSKLESGKTTFASSSSIQTPDSSAPGLLINENLNSSVEHDSLKMNESIQSKESIVEPSRNSNGTHSIPSLLQCAETSPSYGDRDLIYRHITKEDNIESTYYAIAWYLRGLNDLEQARYLYSKNDSPELAKKAFERATNTFKIAANLLSATDKTREWLALKYQAESYFYLDTLEGYESASLILTHLIKDEVLQAANLESPDDIFYLFVLANVKMNELENKDDRMTAFLIPILHKQIELFPHGESLDKSLNLLGVLYYKENNFEKAEESFLTLANTLPASPLAPAALYGAAKSADAIPAHASKAKDYRRVLYEKYPEDPLAAEAYFTYYTYTEYLQGNRAALKHLETFIANYPNSTFLPNAYYLIGMDYKRDRKTVEGKWIRKKNLVAAIDAFQSVVQQIDKLNLSRSASVEHYNQYSALRYRATYERALANLAISNESEGAKSHIYMTYAIETLKQLCAELKQVDTLLELSSATNDYLNNLLEESTYWLAHAYHKNQQNSEAEKELNILIDRLESAKVTRGYYLSRAWNEKGMIAFEQKKYDTALAYFFKSEDTAKGKLLNTEQGLTLWIQQSLCYKELNDLDHSHLILSKVINDDSISSLRIKAMYLRAEVYELQERYELAQKQLEATAKKGGDWALKAKLKLEKEYGYR